jgi:phosphatidylglycerol---prolipoprotein diacylglyceryl transferase
VRPVPVAFHIGPLLVHTYGLGLAVTFWFAYRYFERRLRVRGYPTNWVLALFIWVTAAAIVGARVMHVLANLSYYRADPAQVFAVWHGGLSSWGGLLLAVPTGVLVARRRCPQLRFGAAMDIVAPVLASAWAMGRLLGPQLMYAGGGHPTHQWFGMYYAGEVGKRLPVPIFQAAEDFAIFCALIVVERRIGRLVESRGEVTAGTAPPAGAVIGTGMVLWGVERVLDEKLWLAYPGQLGDVLVEAAGLALAIAGVVVLLVARRRFHAWLTAGPSITRPPIPRTATPATAAVAPATTAVAPATTAVAPATTATPAVTTATAPVPAKGAEHAPSTPVRAGRRIAADRVQG